MLENVGGIVGSGLIIASDITDEAAGFAEREAANPG